MLTPFSPLLADPQSAVGATTELAYDTGLPTGQTSDQLGVATTLTKYQGVLFSLPEGTSSSVLKSVRFYAGEGTAAIGIHILNTDSSGFTPYDYLTPALTVTISAEKWYEVNLADVAVPNKFWVFLELTNFNVSPFYDEGRTGPSWNGFKPDQLVMGGVDEFKRPQGDFLIRAYITTGAATTDTTPPTTPAVTDDGTTTTSTSQLHATWSSSDDESDIAEYQYAIGTTTGATDTVEWTSAGTDTAVTHTGLSLSVGSTYFFAVKAKNGVGLWSAIGASDGILIEANGDGNGGNGEAGGCSCSKAKAGTSMADVAIFWGALGMCSGTAYFFARRVGRQKRR